MTSAPSEEFERDVLRLAEEKLLVEEICAHRARVTEEIDVPNVGERLAERYRSLVEHSQAPT